jgi:hypothetical protein
VFGLLSLAPGVNEEQRDGKHDGQIRQPDAYGHQFIDADDDKASGQREQDNVRQFHKLIADEEFTLRLFDFIFAHVLGSLQAGTVDHFLVKFDVDEFFGKNSLGVRFPEQLFRI